MNNKRFAKYMRYLAYAMFTFSFLMLFGLVLLGLCDAVMGDIGLQSRNVLQAVGCSVFLGALGMVPLCVAWECEVK